MFSCPFVGWFVCQQDYVMIELIKKSSRLSSPSAGVLRKSHRHLDGRLSAVCVLGPAGVRRRQLHRPPTQGAAALPTEATTHEGEHRLTSATKSNIYIHIYIFSFSSFHLFIDELKSCIKSILSKETK